MFLTRFLSFSIYLLEKLNDIVTARGNPSGMAHTTTEMAMMMLLSMLIQNLFSLSNLKESSTQSFSAQQLIMFPQPHGMILSISRTDLTIIEAIVSIAAQIPTQPIFSAIIANFFYKSVSLSPSSTLSIDPAAVFRPTDVTIALPLPLTHSDLARRTPLYSLILQLS